MSSIRISLIICTRDRRDSLAACLDHLRRVDTPSEYWELIIVDNGSRDGTAQLIREFAGSVPFRVMTVREPRPGLGWARNAGLASATGDIISFTDDDCYVDRSYLDEILKIFSNYNVKCIGGRILLHDPSDARVTIKESMETVILEPHSFVYAGFIQGANMAARRDVLAELGGFDVMLGSGTPFIADDVDFVGRVSWAGYRVGYFPGPLIYHHHRRKPGKDANAISSKYDYGRGAYYAKFLIIRPSRGLYMRHFCSSISFWIRRGYCLPPVREMVGALHYALRAAMDRRSGKDPRSMVASQ